MKRGILPLILVGIVFVLLTDKIFVPFAFGLRLPSQLALALADAECLCVGLTKASIRSLNSSTVLTSPTHKQVSLANHKTASVVGELISDFREAAEDSIISQQTPSSSLSPPYTEGMKGGVDAATAQYLLGVMEYNEGNVEAAKVWFQRAWEALEDNPPPPLIRGTETGKVTALPTSSTAPAKIHFPEGYKVNVYYRDGWYIQPKDASVGRKSMGLPSLPHAGGGGTANQYSFLPGSTYKIRVEAEEDGRPESGSMSERINTGIKVIATLVMLSWLMSR